MNQELAKKLEAAGLTWNDDYPTLEELIEACGFNLESIIRRNDGEWEVRSKHERFFGKTLIEAVAKLWLALNN